MYAARVAQLEKENLELRERCVSEAQLVKELTELRGKENNNKQLLSTKEEELERLRAEEKKRGELLRLLEKELRDQLEGLQSLKLTAEKDQTRIAEMEVVVALRFPRSRAC